MDPVTVCMINTVYRDMMLSTSKDATYLNSFLYFEVSLDFLHFHFYHFYHAAVKNKNRWMETRLQSV